MANITAYLLEHDGEQDWGIRTFASLPRRNELIELQDGTQLVVHNISYLEIADDEGGDIVILVKPV